MVLKISNPFGTQWVLQGKKHGGANNPGFYGGIYRHSDNNSRALFKQDIRDGKIRIAKVVGEGLAGSFLNDLYPLLGVDKRRFAHTELVQSGAHATLPILTNEYFKADESGEKTYLMSVYIAGYESDFWKYAFQNEYERRYRNEIDVGNHKQLYNVIKKARKFYIDRITAEADVEKKAHMLADVKNYLGETALNEFIASNNTAAKEKLIQLLAIAAVEQMQRPSTVFNFRARRVASAALQDNPEFVKEFAQITAPRLLFADFGVHYGNFGVAKIDGSLHLVALDFGAAFSKLFSKVNPFSRTKSGANNYLNHFVEYDTAVSASEAMAQEFIRIGYIPKHEMIRLVTKGVNELNDKFGIEPLKKFCQRMGMKYRDYNTENKSELQEKMRVFMESALRMRQESMKEQGFALLLEHCIDKDKVLDLGKLRDYLTGNGLAKALGYSQDEQLRQENRLPDDEQLKKEFIEFAMCKFNKFDLIIHSSMFPGREQSVKDVLVTAVKVLTTPRFNSSADVDAYMSLAIHFENEAKKLLARSMPKQIRAKKLRDIYNECTRMQNNLMGSDYSNKKAGVCLGKLNVTLDLISSQGRKRKYISAHKADRISLFGKNKHPVSSLSHPHGNPSPKKNRT